MSRLALLRRLPHLVAHFGFHAIDGAYAAVNQGCVRLLAVSMQAGNGDRGW